MAGAAPKSSNTNCERALGPVKTGRITRARKAAPKRTEFFLHYSDSYANVCSLAYQCC